MKSQVTPQNATSNADKHGTRTGTDDQSLNIAWGGDGEGIGGFILGGGTRFSRERRENQSSLTEYKGNCSKLTAKEGGSFQYYKALGMVWQILL